MGLLRQLNRKSTAFTRRALHLDLSLVGLHDMFDDRQPQSGPPQLATACLVDPVKTLEQAGQMFARDTAALILDRDGQLTSGPIDSRNLDVLIRFAVLDRIVEQVDQCLFQQRCIQVGGQGFRTNNLEGDLFLPGLDLTHLESAL